VTVVSRESPAASNVWLFERTDELDAIRGMIVGTADGASGTGVIRGVPGAGKTSLLRAARSDAHARGLRVLGARGSPHERDYAFAVVRQLLGPVVLAAGASGQERLFSGAARHAQHLFDPPAEEPRLAPRGDPAYATLHGLFWLLAGIAQSEPVVVIVDDAHWCDPPSGRFLSFLSRRLDGLAVTLLLAERSGEDSTNGWLAELGDDPGTQVITPLPLSPQAITAIAADRVSGAADEALGHACWQATGGNPFFVTSALDELVRDPGRPDTRVSRLRELGPETVLRSVLIRLARLPPGAVALAHAVAVLGDGATLDSAAELGRLPLAEAQTAGEGLRAIGVLVPDRVELSFAHPIVRNALYRDLTSAARTALHADAALMLAGAGAPPAQVVIHLLRSPPGQKDAAGTLESAAGDAMRQGAPQVAARYLSRALEEPLDNEGRARVMIDLGCAEAQAGDADAVEHLTAGLRGATDPGRRVDAAVTLAHTLAANERTAESVAILSVLGDQLTESHPKLAGRVFSELVSLGDLIARPLVSARARRLAPSSDPAGLTHRAVELTASASSASEASHLAQAALADGELLARGDAVFAFACAMLIYTESFDAAKRFLDQALGGATAAGSAPGFIGASGQRALLNTRRGALLEAEADARAALEASELHGWQFWPAHTLAALIDVLLARGQAPQAAAELERALPSGEPVGNQGALFIEARGRLHLELGETRAGVTDLLEAGRRLEEWGLHNPSVAAWRSHAALGLAALGDRQRAGELVQDEVTLARRWGTPRTLGVALRAQALVGNDERTIPLLHDACATLERSQAPVERARALTDLGAALRRTNQRAEAREHLRVALDIAVSTGAASLVQRARTELEATGARARIPLRSGVDGLTPSERRIAQMAAAGQTNTTIAQNLFVTIKTVEMHLTSTYRKLDIGSRTQIAAAMKVAGS
jgi:DNA-binding CsgD family transcriptional regulator/tetratricopeptide (TPR) repeat protein